MKRFDHMVIGLLTGLGVPVLGGYIYFMLTWGRGMALHAFITDHFFHSLFVKVMSIAIYISNLPLFFLFIWTDRLNSARGVLFATVMYTLWVVYEKFF